MKKHDIETLSKITTNDDLKQYCRDLGWEEKEVRGIKF
jgi:hypothetical protein